MSATVWTRGVAEERPEKGPPATVERKASSCSFSPTEDTSGRICVRKTWCEAAEWKARGLSHQQGETSKQNRSNYSLWEQTFLWCAFESRILIRRQSVTSFSVDEFFDNGAGGDPHTRRAIHRSENTSPPHFPIFRLYASLPGELGYLGDNAADEALVGHAGELEVERQRRGEKREPVSQLLQREPGDTVQREPGETGRLTAASLSRLRLLFGCLSLRLVLIWPLQSSK